MATPSGGRPATGVPSTVSVPVAEIGEAGDAAQQRGLAAAARADDAQDLVARDRERELPERHHGAVEEQLGGVVGDDDGIAGGHSGSLLAHSSLVPGWIIIPTVVDRNLSTSSWPGLSRPSMPLIPSNKQGVDARDTRGHDKSEFTAVGITRRRRKSARVGRAKAHPDRHFAPSECRLRAVPTDCS